DRRRVGARAEQVPAVNHPLGESSSSPQLLRRQPPNCAPGRARRRPRPGRKQAVGGWRSSTLPGVVDPLLLGAIFFGAAVLYSSVGHAGASAYLAAMGLLGIA